MAQLNTFYAESFAANGGGAQDMWMSIFNTSATTVVKVYKVMAAADDAGDEFGIAPELRRISTAPTGGAVITPAQADTTDPALPAAVTIRNDPGGTPTLAGNIAVGGLARASGLAQGTHWTQIYNAQGDGEQKPITLRQNQGVQLRDPSGLGPNIFWSLVFTVE